MRALRSHTLSADFTAVLEEAIVVQAALRYQLAAYNEHLDALRARYTSEQLAARAVVRCTGGD